MDVPVINGLFVFGLGMLVVFFGMIVIILSVSLCGKIMNKSNAPEKKAEVKPEPIAMQTQAPVEESEEIPAHVKAAIVAAISAYYFNQKSNCDFVVRKIRRF